MARSRSTRPRSFSSFVTAGLQSGTGFAGGFGRIYALGLLLLVMLFFMLTFRGRTPRAIERVFTTPVAMDQAALDARHQHVSSLHGGAYLDPKDGAEFAQTPGYERLIRTLVDHVRPDDVVANPPMFNRELALQAPDMQRGEVVKIRGFIAGHWAEKLDKPVFQVEDVWRVFLTDGEGMDGVVVDVIAQPPVVEERRQMVEIVGTFYRLVRYETKTGATVEVPYLLARSLTVMPDEIRSGMGLDDPASIVLLIALAAMVVWGVLRVVNTHSRRPTVRWRAPHPAPPT